MRYRYYFLLVTYLLAYFVYDSFEYCIPFFACWFYILVFGD